MLILNSWLQERSPWRWVRTDCSRRFRDCVHQHSWQQAGTCFQKSLPFSPTSSTPRHDAVEEVARGRGGVGRKDNRYKNIPLGPRSHLLSPEVPILLNMYTLFCVYILSNNPPMLGVNRWMHAHHSTTSPANTARHRLEGHPPAQALMTLSDAPSATPDLIPLLCGQDILLQQEEREHCTCLLQTPTPHHSLAGATKPTYCFSLKPSRPTGSSLIRNNLGLPFWPYFWNRSDCISLPN